MQIDHANPMSRHIGDEQPRLIRAQRQPVRLHQSSLGGWSAIAAVHPRSIPAKVDTTPVVSITRTRRFSRSAKNTRPERSIDHAIGLVQLRARGRPAIAGKSLLAGAANRRDNTARRIDPADAMIERIGKNQAAIRGKRQIERIVQAGVAAPTIRLRNNLARRFRPRC